MGRPWVVTRDEKGLGTRDDRGRSPPKRGAIAAADARGEPRGRARRRRGDGRARDGRER